MKTQTIKSRGKTVTSMNDYYKADLAEISHKHYEKFLLVVDKVSNREMILLYCLLHRAISMRQICIYFVYSNDKKAIEMVIHRLVKNKLIKKISYNNDKGYYITLSGINECKRIIQRLSDAPLSDIMVKSENHSFTLEDIIEYLSSRCLNYIPTYWHHYFAERDIYVYLLSNEVFNRKFEYETEVAISGNGVISSIINRKLLGVNTRYEIRSDAMLKYYPKCGDNYLKFLIEVDTGSQSACILSQKVQKYITNYYNTRSSTPDTSLVFSIIADDPIDDKKYLCNEKLTITDSYYAFALSCIGEVIALYGLSLKKVLTIGDLLSKLEEVLLDHKNNWEYMQLKKLVKYIKGKPTFFNEKYSVYDLSGRYREALVKNNKQRKLITDSVQQKRYSLRKLLLKRSIIDIPDVKAALLKGFSIYTVANYNLENTLGYIHPEVKNYGNHIIDMLATTNIVGMREKPEYRLQKQIMGETVFLRNFYYFAESKVSIIVENISDDIGGFYRIFNLLDEDTIPLSLIDTKMICLCDIHSIEEMKVKYLKTKQGMRLAKCCTEKINNGFDVLFTTYPVTNYRDDTFFSFSSEANNINKTMSEKPVNS